MVTVSGRLCVQKLRVNPTTDNRSGPGVGACRFEVQLIAVFCLCALTAQGAGTEYAPKPGSPERQAICDAARAFVLNKYAIGTLPQPIVFKIGHLAVEGSYCNFEAIPLFRDGSYVAPRYMPDTGLNFCLRKTDGRWQVIVDLSRTDVPEGAELARIKQTLPPDFPVSLFSPTWRNLLGP